MKQTLSKLQKLRRNARWTSNYQRSILNIVQQKDTKKNK